MKKIVYFGFISLLTILSIIAYLYREQLFYPNVPIKQLVEEQPVLCNSNDTACIQRHANNLVNQLSGYSVEFAKHQCSGPHPCPTPDQQSIVEATNAIREYTKNDSLQLIPINGVTPSGIIYYCANDNRCWKVEANTNKVISSVEAPTTPTSSAKRILPR